VDPAKAAEPTKPRGSTSSKRPARPSDGDMQIKRSRLDSSASTKHPLNLNAMIDPALLADAGSATALADGTTDLTNVQAASAALNFMNGEAMRVDSTAVRPSTAGSMEVKQDPDQMQSPNVSHHPTIELSAGYVVPEQAVEDDPDPKAAITPHPSASPVSQRQSSRQPKQVERFVPEDHRSPSKPQPSARRASSAVSGHTIINSVKSRRSSSNTSATLMNGVHMAAKESATVNGAARSDSQGRESTVEEEDERIARALQQEEHGLRRRTSMRV
jgi:F-box and leucine-rich repeat protein 10/11